jgi:hypothetical protein
MLVHLVNFEKCHSPIHLWLSQTRTVSALLGGSVALATSILKTDDFSQGGVILSYVNVAHRH